MAAWPTNIVKRARRKLKSGRGASLGEMLACVVLFSLAFTAGVSGLLFAINSTAAVMQAADAQKVSDSILNRVSGELANMADGEEGKNKVYLAAAEGNTPAAIAFTSASGIPVYITLGYDSESDIVGHVAADQVVVYYWHTKVSDEATASQVPSSLWTFDEKAYRNYTVTGMSFSTGAHNGKLTVSTTLTLKSPTGKEFVTKRTVCCYQREDAEVDTSRSREDIMEEDPIHNEDL